MKKVKSDIFYICFIAFMLVLFVISMYEALQQRLDDLIKQEQGKSTHRF